MNLPLELQRNAAKGQIGEAALTDFFGYMRMFNELPNVKEEIFPDPENAMIPEMPDVLYALCSNIAHKVCEDTASSMVTYIRRFRSKEFAAFCIRDCIARNPGLKKNADVANWVVTEGRDLLL